MLKGLMSAMKQRVLSDEPPDSNELAGGACLPSPSQYWSGEDEPVPNTSLTEQAGADLPASALLTDEARHAADLNLPAPLPLALSPHASAESSHIRPVTGSTTPDSPDAAAAHRPVTWTTPLRVNALYSSASDEEAPSAGNSQHARSAGRSTSPLGLRAIYSPASRRKAPSEFHCQQPTYAANAAAEAAVREVDAGSTVKAPAQPQAQAAQVKLQMKVDGLAADSTVSLELQVMPHSRRLYHREFAMAFKDRYMHELPDFNQACRDLLRKHMTTEDIMRAALHLQQAQQPRGRQYPRSISLPTTPGGLAFIPEYGQGFQGQGFNRSNSASSYYSASPLGHGHGPSSARHPFRPPAQAPYAQSAYGTGPDAAANSPMTAGNGSSGAPWPQFSRQAPPPHHAAWPPSEGQDEARWQAAEGDDGMENKYSQVHSNGSSAAAVQGVSDGRFAGIVQEKLDPTSGHFDYYFKTAWNAMDPESRAAVIRSADADLEAAKRQMQPFIQPESHHFVQNAALAWRALTSGEKAEQAQQAEEQEHDPVDAAPGGKGRRSLAHPLMPGSGENGSGLIPASWIQEETQDSRKRYADWTETGSRASEASAAASGSAESEAEYSEGGGSYDLVNWQPPGAGMRPTAAAKPISQMPNTPVAAPATAARHGPSDCPAAGPKPGAGVPDISPAADAKRRWWEKGDVADKLKDISVASTRQADNTLAMTAEVDEFEEQGLLSPTAHPTSSRIRADVQDKLDNVPKAGERLADNTLKVEVTKDEFEELGLLEAEDNTSYFSKLAGVAGARADPSKMLRAAQVASKASTSAASQSTRVSVFERLGPAKSSMPVPDDLDFPGMLPPSTNSSPEQPKGPAASGTSVFERPAPVTTTLASRSRTSGTPPALPSGGSRVQQPVLAKEDQILAEMKRLWQQRHPGRVPKTRDYIEAGIVRSDVIYTVRDEDLIMAAINSVLQPQQPAVESLVGDRRWR
ncbi:hypothetical protein WJX72_000402 [[Myrmecia] bisecta]|uniref:Uncharacterized protein n=1 Tax=[Myrmecia] bisecta TaxID=41462 RepID=A0AAW1P6C1_9CHLO